MVKDHSDTVNDIIKTLKYSIINIYSGWAQSVPNQNEPQIHHWFWGPLAGLSAHSEQAVIAHACHGHTLQLLTGLSDWNRRLVISSNPVRG